MTIGRVVLGHNNNPACILVEPMNYPGSQWSSQVSQMVAMMEEPVDEGGSAMTGGRMHHEARRFIDSNQMVVFKNYVQREWFRLELDRWGWRNKDLNLIFQSKFVARLLGLIINQNAVVVDKSLHLIARQFQAHAAQKQVKPGANVLLGNFKTIFGHTPLQSKQRRGNTKAQREILRMTSLLFLRVVASPRRLVFASSCLLETIRGW